MPHTVDRAIFREVGSEVKYGAGYGLATLFKFAAQLAFVDIEFPPPYETWLSGATGKEMHREPGARKRR